MHVLACFEMGINFLYSKVEGYKMAKLKGKGVVLAGLVAGAASFFRKKENRDKAMDLFIKTKEKINDNGGIQGLMQKATNKMNQPIDKKEHIKGKIAATGNNDYAEESLKDIAMTAAKPVDTVLEGNHMLEEGGGQTTINDFNEKQHENKQA